MEARVELLDKLSVFVDFTFEFWVKFLAILGEQCFDEGGGGGVRVELELAEEGIDACFKDLDILMVLKPENLSKLTRIQ